MFFKAVRLFRFLCLLVPAIVLVSATPALPEETARARVSGFLTKDGKAVFPIGCYELPEDDTALKEMADAGINLIRCRDKESLDRVGAVGVQGWVCVPLQLGDNEKLRAKIMAVKDHPALAVWEGPDEIVHNFTRYSGLYRKSKVHKSPNDWVNQAPNAVEYAEKQAAKIIPGLYAGAELIRSLDARNRPIWVNEANNSDLKYVRAYLDGIDITGCDLYPVSATNGKVTVIGDATDRWMRVRHRGEKPVWMVLQAFSWHELGDYYKAKKAAYPTFNQSRQMAYIAIAHGAKGILYWGSSYLKSDEFRTSLYALTRELAELQPFLVAPHVEGVRAGVVEVRKSPTDLDVRAFARKSGDDWIVVVINKDNRAHLATEVLGLEELNGRKLVLLYGNEETTVSRGELITRMLPNQVKVFATSRKWEAEDRKGREYGDN